MLYYDVMEKVCDICGGSGQIGQFLGVSRFVITWEECPECCGTGVFKDLKENADQNNDSSSISSDDKKIDKFNS